MDDRYIYNNFKDKNFPIVLIGNKVDRSEERAVRKDEGESEGQKYNIKFFEISCKNDINIREPILYLISQISKGGPGKEVILLSPKKKRRKCC